MRTTSSIINRAKNGDESAFAEIFNAYHNRIYYFALNHVKSPQDAEDIVQNTFTEVFKSLNALSNEEAFKSWLYTLTQRQVGMLYRKNERTPQTENLTEEAFDDGGEFLPENIMQSEEMKAAVMELIQSLPTVQKTAVLLYYFEEMSVGEIAEIQECSVGTVKSRLNYARKYIKSEIEKRRKKGNYILSVAPIPLLTRLLREMAERNYLTQSAATRIFTESCTTAGIVVSQATVKMIVTEAGKTTGSAATSAAATGGMTFLTKAVACGVALCVVVLGAVFVLLNNSDTPEVDYYAPVALVDDIETDEPVQNAVEFSEVSTPTQELDEVPETDEPLQEIEEETETDASMQENEEATETDEPLQDVEANEPVHEIEEAPETAQEVIATANLGEVDGITLTGINNEQLAHIIASGEMPYTAIFHDTQWNEIEVFNIPDGLSSFSGTLILSGNQISDISPLAGLTNLTGLILNNNQIRDIAPLTGLTNLITLHMNNNQISDISPLAGLTNLRGVQMNNNQISDISPLTELANLHILWLSGNQISNVSPLARHTNLMGLHLDRNQISDITPLAGLTDLMFLHLCNNQIRDISPLTGLTSLDGFYLRNNQISDISPLSHLVDGQVNVFLNDNPITDWSPVSHLSIVDGRPYQHTID